METLQEPIEETASRKLATIETILNLEPIPEADRIETATVRGWKVVVQKGLHKVGDKVIYCEIDSFLPEKPEYEFLRKGGSYKVLADGSRGFRLKTIRLRGVTSQGIVFPLSLLNTVGVLNNDQSILEVQDK